MKRKLKLLPNLQITQIEKVSFLYRKPSMCEDIQLVEGGDSSTSFRAYLKLDNRLKCTILNPERNYIVITQKEGDDMPTLNIIFCENTGSLLRPNLTYVIFDSEFSQIDKVSHEMIVSKVDEILGDNLLKYESWSTGNKLKSIR